MINFLDVNAEGGKELIQAFARIENNRDFALILTKLRVERTRIRKHVCNLNEEITLRQNQGAAQILDDIIEAAETARDFA